MGRPAAIRLHAALSLLGLALYVVFVIPRWWVLTGDIPPTAATAGRIAAGLPIALGAVPVWLVLQGSLNSGLPELALRLRAWSGMLHVVAGVLIVLTAVAEIWLGLGAAGPWLFAVYGAAGAMAVLAVLGFYLSFVAEKPPAGPKPPKAEKPKGDKRRGRKRGGGADEPAPDEPAPDEAAVDAAAEGSAKSEQTAEDNAAEEKVTEQSGTPAASDEPDADGPEADEPAAVRPTDEGSVLRNKRPTGKRRHRLPRSGA